MAKVRKDNKGRNLRPGETQRADGSYMYVYKLGTKKKYLYDSDLASLRVKEKQINKDKDDGIRTQEAMKLTLNDMFKVYMNNNIKLKPSTRANYLYLWDFYVKEEPFANMPLPQIHRSDILAFYTKLLKHGFAINSVGNKILLSPSCPMPLCKGSKLAQYSIRETFFIRLVSSCAVLFASKVVEKL